MNGRIVTTGLALSLLSASAAYAQSQPEPMVLAQASGAAQYLSDGRPASALSVPELRQRVQAGVALIQNPNTARPERQRVRQMVQAARAELQKRRGTASTNNQQQTAQKPAAKKPAQNTGTAAQDETGQAQTQTQNQQQTAQAGGGSAAAAQYLSDTRAPGDLTPAELRRRVQTGAALVRDPKVSRPERQRVRQMVQAARAELQKRRGAGSQATQGQDTTGQGQGNQQAGADTAAGSTNATQYLSEARSPADLSDAELRQRMAAGRQLLTGSGVTGPDRRRVQQAVAAARAELAKRRAGGTGNQQTGTDQQTGTGNQQAGSQTGGAANTISDDREAKILDDRELRERLNRTRASLQNRDLPPDQLRKLRQKLRADRMELRDRVGRKRPNDDTRVTDRDRQQFENDRRAPRELNEAQLNRRMQFYRDRLARTDISDAERRGYREFLERDRAFFRTRWQAARQDRIRELRRRRDANQINIQINIIPQGPAYPVGVPPPPVWVAEADDEMILEQLVRRPARQYNRRYTFEEVAAEPELRDEMPAVEIDTIKFGFNESQLREEDYEALDRVGSVLEEIVAAHPGEVFMIEGHTDAVGSDEYNLNLSRERAASVKQALTEFYQIKPENLRTVGYGERFLKIPTEEEEEENRRVTVRRITPLVGELAN